MLKKIESDFLFDGQILNLVLNAPPGNILDKKMISELTQALEEKATNSSVKAILFQGAGEHFSYGASIPEHTKEVVGELLSSFHKFFRTLIKVSKPCFALVRGQCLGGGLELAAFCNWIFASEEARFGQPEINLGVFPPIASLVLPHRIGQSAADDLLLTGRSLNAREAEQMRLVHSVSEDPEKGLHAFISAHILPKSAAALNFTMKSARFEMHQAFLQNIDAVEKLYVQDLTATSDANEGIKAFMEKRAPVWQDR